MKKIIKDQGRKRVIRKKSDDEDYNPKKRKSSKKLRKSKSKKKLKSNKKTVSQKLTEIDTTKSQGGNTTQSEIETENTGV